MLAIPHLELHLLLAPPPHIGLPYIFPYTIVSLNTPIVPPIFCIGSANVDRLEVLTRAVLEDG
jgi:hypothetical protein